MDAVVRPAGVPVGALKVWCNSQLGQLGANAPFLIRVEPVSVAVFM